VTRRASRGELMRKLVHVAAGLLAFAAGPLGSAGALALALSALVFNAFLFPHLGGRRLWRPAEIARGQAHGIVLYPLAVAVMIAIFWNRLEIAAACWGLLGFGDGFAGLAGQTLGRKTLPWNAEKTWVGSLAYVAAGTPVAAALLVWTLAHTAPERQLEWPVALLIGALAALVGAIFESLPQGLDDNLVAPLPTGLVLLGLLQTAEAGPAWGEIAAGAGPGVAISLVLAGLAWATGAADRSGAAAGFAVAAAIWTGTGWRGFLLLAAFVVAGTAATRLGYGRKAALGIAQEAGGRRGARHVLANLSVPAVAALFAATTTWAPAYLLVFTGALATATADTLGSELGQLWGRRAFLPTTFARVPPGTDGAISLEGTLAGLAGAASIAGLGWAMGFFGAVGALAVTAAAFLGTLIESFLGVTLERRGLLDNEALNFLNTLAGGLLAVALATVPTWVLA